MALKKEDSLSNLKLAVVGHVEWMTFLKVDKLPQAGLITHAIKHKEEPAGGGAVSAVQMTNLTKQSVHFFTALGKDSIGEKSYARLKELGLKLNVVWRDEPTRKGISFVDNKGERSITIIGKRLEPKYSDDLPWETIKDFDGVFITAADYLTIRNCRQAKKLIATPRVNLRTLDKANIQLDALIGSGIDPDEKIPLNKFRPNTKLIILTKGAEGGSYYPGRSYKGIKLKSPVIDSYGCGDSFASGVTAGIAAGWSNEQAIELGAKCGGLCATFFGPYI